ncbi:MAG: hypothetical protein AAF432_14415 [Planctomycetota bacterium]
MTIRQSGVFFISACVLALPCAVHAGLVEITFEARIDQIADQGNGPSIDGLEELNVGDPFIISFVLDDEAPDQSSLPGFGVYDLISGTMTLGSFHFAASTGQLVVEPNESVLDDALFLSDDWSPGPTQAGVRLDGVNAIDTDDILTMIDLDLWPFVSNQALFGDLFVIGIVDRVTTTPIPAPATLAGLVIPLFTTRRRVRMA